MEFSGRLGPASGCGATSGADDIGSVSFCLMDVFQGLPDAEDLIGENGLLKQLTKILVERALEVEMTNHLGHDKSGGGDQYLAA